MQANLTMMDEPRRVGRPRDPAKYAAIIAAARQAFFNRGFHAATVEEIAQSAGVSKVTVYSRFGDKETLLEEVIRAENMRIANAFDAQIADQVGLDEQLNTCGIAMMELMFSEANMAIDRVLMNELAQLPDLARRFYEAGPAAFFAQLASVLTAAAKRGDVQLDDPHLAAEDLCGLWKGASDIGVKLGLEPPPTSEMIIKRVERATALFLRMVAVKV